MYVSIDMDRQVILHKHHDQHVVSGISWLECGQQTSIRIDNSERDEFLRGVAHGDLCHLYKNTTGDDFHEQAWGDRAAQFRERLREAVRNMPATLALIDEVEAQAEAVDDRLRKGEVFKYVLGARVPAQPQELFPLQAAPLAPVQIQAADARAAIMVSQQREREERERAGELLPQAHAAKAPQQEAPEADEAPKLAKARAGSVQPIVFAAAAAAWAARQPNETWSDIRSRLAEKLTADGHHPTTVRIKLSKWAKENGI
jgi:hypothetical protein